MPSFIAHPNWSGSGDYSDDLGLIVLDGALTVPSSAYAWVWDESASGLGSQVTSTIYGYSRQDRSGNAIWYGHVLPTAWRTNCIKAKRPSASSPFTCSGDSGGPIERPFAPRFTVAGALSGGDKGSDGRCTKVGGEMRWAATDHKTGWIAANVPGGCDSVRDRDGNDYLQCF